MGSQARLTRPAILGAGSWGTALSLVLARRGLPVSLWVHNRERAEQLSATRRNDTHLPGFLLPSSVRVTGDLAGCIAESDIVVFAMPSHAVRSVGLLVRPLMRPDACLMSAAKGITEFTLQTMSQVLGEACGTENLAVLSGPSFAMEVARELPTAVVAASADPHLAQAVQQLFSGSRFRVYASQDVPGVELGGAVKNVIAIAAGVCHGLHLGQNAVAALITRGLAEMSRLAASQGGHPQTLAGLAGLGDLVLTCNGEMSRNRQVGIQLASGKTVEEITAELNSVAEGIRTTNSVVALGQRANIALPICEQMHAVLHGRCAPTEAIRILMDRSLGGE